MSSQCFAWEPVVEVAGHVALPVRPVDLDDRNTLTLELAGEPRALAAGALDPDHDDFAVGTQPPQQGPIASWGSRKRLHTEERAELVEGCGDVHLEMGVDAAGDLCCH